MSTGAFYIRDQSHHGDEAIAAETQGSLNYSTGPAHEGLPPVGGTHPCPRLITTWGAVI